MDEEYLYHVIQRSTGKLVYKGNEPPLIKLDKMFKGEYITYKFRKFRQWTVVNLSIGDYQIWLN